MANVTSVALGDCLILRMLVRLFTRIVGTRNESKGVIWIVAYLTNRTCEGIESTAEQRHVDGRRRQHLKEKASRLCWPPCSFVCGEIKLPHVFSEKPKQLAK